LPAGDARDRAGHLRRETRYRAADEVVLDLQNRARAEHRGTQELPAL
jgi:hypothetical protein